MRPLLAVIINGSLSLFSFSLCLSLCSIRSLFSHLSVHPSVCLSVCLSIYLSVCMCVCLSITSLTHSLSVTLPFSPPFPFLRLFRFFLSLAFFSPFLVFSFLSLLSPLRPPLFVCGGA